MTTGGKARALLILGLSLACGCQQNNFSTSIWNPLGLETPFTLARKPIRIGVVAQKSGLLAPENWLPVRPAPPYAGLRNALASHFGVGVQIEEFTPFQVAAHLHSGRLQFALISESDYLTMTEEFEKAESEPLQNGPPEASTQPAGPAWTVLAQGQSWVRRGLIVASAKSDVQNLTDIAGKRFAFGPKDDPVLHLGALRTLEAAGVGKDKIAKELLPISSLPDLDLLQHHVSSAEAAKEIVYGLATPVGVIEEGDYETYPEIGGRLLPLRFAKDNFRILGRTEPVTAETSMAGPFLASSQADPEIVEKVQVFLTQAGEKHPEALHALGLARFEMREDAAAAGIRMAETAPAEP